MKTSEVLIRIKEMLRNDATLAHIEQVKIVNSPESVELEFLAENLITISEAATDVDMLLGEDDNTRLNIVVVCYYFRPSHMEDVSLKMADMKQLVQEALHNKSLQGTVDNLQALVVGESEEINFKEAESEQAYYALRSIIDVTAHRYGG